MELKIKRTPTSVTTIKSSVTLEDGVIVEKEITRFDKKLQTDIMFTIFGKTYHWRF